MNETHNYPQLEPDILPNGRPNSPNTRDKLKDSHSLNFQAINIVIAFSLYSLFEEIPAIRIATAWIATFAVISYLLEFADRFSLRGASLESSIDREAFRTLYLLVSILWGGILFYLALLGNDVQVAFTSALALVLVMSNSFAFASRYQGRLVSYGFTLSPLLIALLLRADFVSSLMAMMLIFIVVLIDRSANEISNRYLGAIASSDQNFSLANELALLSGTVQRKNSEITVLNSQLHKKIKDIEAHKNDLQAQKEKVDALSAELAIECRTDALTTILNRRGFDEALKREWARSRREQLPLSLILCDIDSFKQYNDSYGHLKGDECLGAVADTLRRTVKRETDIVARYGGEEFVLLLPETSEDGALKIAERARNAVMEKGLPHLQSLFGNVTLSFGVSCIVPEKTDHAASLIKSADHALYKAKDGGRNCVRAASSSTRQ